MTQIISFISGKGGVGKTTVTSNLGLALSKMGKSVLLIDGNVSGANLGMHYGVVDYDSTLNDVLNGKISFQDAVKNLEGYGTSSKYFHIIPSSISSISADMSRLKDLLKVLVGHYDYILVDGAAGTDDEVDSVVEVSDKVMIVTNPEIPSLSNAMLAKNIALKKNKEVMGVILNRVRGEDHEMSLYEVEEFLSIPVVGIIRNGRRVSSSLSKGKPVVYDSPHSRASRDIIQTASNMINGHKSSRFNDSVLHKILDAIVE